MKFDHLSCFSFTKVLKFAMVQSLVVHECVTLIDQCPMEVARLKYYHFNYFRVLLADCCCLNKTKGRFMMREYDFVLDIKLNFEELMTSS